MSELVLLASFHADTHELFCQMEERAGFAAAFVFSKMVEDELALLARHPGIAPLTYAPYRRLILHNRNFGIFYTLAGRRVVVHRLLDLRMEPAFLRRALGL